MSIYTITSPTNFQVTQEQYDLLNQWVEELKTGNYKQGREKLCNKNNEYCCIGVLGEIAPNIYKVEDFNENSYSFVVKDDFKRRSSVGLGKEFIELTGIPSIRNIGNYFSISITGEEYNIYNNDNFENILIHMNDTIQLSFIEIGEILEKFVNTYIEVQT